MRSEQFKLLIGSEFPFPIAYPFRRALEEKTSKEALCFLLHGVLDFVGPVLLADYLAEPSGDAALDAELGRLLESPPSVGWWQGVIQRILSYMADRSRPPLAKELTALAERSVMKDLRQLVEWRNNWAHHRAQFSRGNFRRRLFSLLDRIIALHKYTLFCPQSERLLDSLNTYDATRFNGDNPLFAEVECRTDVSLESDRVYLHSRNSQELLLLDPFIAFGECDACGEKHYWRYDRPSHEKIVYTSLPGGHQWSSAEAYLSLYRLLQRGRATRCAARFFSVPGGFSGMPRTLTHGDRVGPYVVEELIKLGGMAQIYRVVDTRSKKTFALKLLPVELSRDPLVLRRFEEEAVILKRLEHRSVVALHDLGEDFGDRYLVLDLAVGGRIAGQSCRDLADLPKPIPEADIITIGRQVCDGLQYIHTQGIVHRDLKPGNILVAGNRVVLTDFGISRARGNEKITLTGMPVGTPEYMAPEQIREEEIDHRADIYALGCVLFELATGRPPYRADTPLTTALHHLQTRPPRIQELNPRISDGLSNIITKALQKRVELRYQSAQGFFDDLGRADEEPAGTQVILGEEAPQDAIEKLRRKERGRYKRRIAAVLGACILILVAILWGRAIYREQRVQSLVEKSRSTWERGTAAWPPACADLEVLYRYAPSHPAVESLLREISQRGSLVIHTVPPGAFITITPDTEEGKDLGLDLQPQVLTDRKSFQAGDRIVLTPGHYRVVASAGGKSCRLPVFVGQVAYEDRGDGWVARGRVAVDDVAVWTPTLQQSATRFVFAEAQIIEDVALPEAVSPDYVFVPPGPYWRAQPGPLEKAEQMKGPPANPGFVASGITAFTVLPAILERGFFIKVDEVSVGEFAPWFNKLGKDAFLWRIEARSRELRRESGDIPLERLKALWKPEIEAAQARGFQGTVDAAQSREALCLMKAQAADFGWIQVEERVRKSLEVQLERDKTFPVMDVNSEIAMAYARTQRQAMSRAFVGWVSSEIEKARDVTEQLEGILSACRMILRERVALRALPRALIAGETKERTKSLTSFVKRPLLCAYMEWLYYEVCFANRAPARTALTWTRENEKRLAPALKGRLDEIMDKLADPYLYLSARENSDCRNLLWAYASKLGGAAWSAYLWAHGVGDGKPPSDFPIESANLLLWLEDLLEMEKERHRALSERARQLEAVPADRLWDLEIPWELRMEFGLNQGWNIPTVGQWEKAARGADNRRFPWGNQATLGFATTGPERSGPRTPATNRLSQDKSPYGVWCLAGNMSEWVRPPEQFKDTTSAFLKGGNWWHKSVYANIGCILAVQWGYRGPYAGIRVVREWPVADEDSGKADEDSGKNEQRR